MIYYSLDNVEELAQDNEQFVRKLVTIFIHQISDSLYQMQKHLDVPDLYQLGREAHKLKPSLDLFSITQGRDLIRDLEKMDESGDAAQALSSFNSLKEILLEVKKGLEQESL